jgi:hypothetical protein
LNDTPWRFDAADAGDGRDMTAGFLVQLSQQLSHSRSLFLRKSRRRFGLDLRRSVECF